MMKSALDALARATAHSGARGFGASVLFLKPCAFEVFVPFLERRFPAFVRRYKERFGRSAFLRGEYPEMIHERVRRIRRRYGLDRENPPSEPELWPRDAQLGLFELRINSWTRFRPTNCICAWRSGSGARSRAAREKCRSAPWSCIRTAWSGADAIHRSPPAIPPRMPKSWRCGTRGRR